MESVKLEDIKFALVDVLSETSSKMLSGEIPGAEVSFHRFKSNDKCVFCGESDKIRILFLCYGSVNFLGRNGIVSYKERAVYTDFPGKDITIFSKTDSGVLEIEWSLSEEDLAELETKKDKFPYMQAYQDALQYRDPFKSETTISRAIIIHDFIPRFAMGSVEAKADDLVGQHSHPLLDQFFFSFAENDADLLIDCRILNFKGNTLVHIPLGSNHGVIVRGNQKMHYLWLDFTPVSQKKDAVEYLNEVHKPTGVKESLR